MTKLRKFASPSARADALIKVAKDVTGLITVTVQEMRDDEPPPPFGCRLERLEDACDEEGAGIFPMVIQASDLTSSAGTNAGKPTPYQQRFLDILAEAISAAKPEDKIRACVPGERFAITREWLKTYCFAKGFIDRKDKDNRLRAKLSGIINTLAGKT